MFYCSRCGLCCKHIDKIPQLSEYHDGDGICRYLVDNKCSIYESRPDICNVDYVYKTFFSEIYSLQEFYELNYYACNELKSGKL